jgi:hypothetical protein
VIDDDVAQCANGVVEVPAVLDAEVFGHRDLNGLEVVPGPERLEHRVREAQEQDLFETHLPEVVVDSVELGLVQVLVKLGGELVRGSAIMAERLLDDHAPGLRQACLGEPLDDPTEEEGWNLEVEDGRLGPVDRLPHALVRGVVAEIARDVGEALSQTVEDLLVERLAGACDRLARAILELIDGPVVDRDAHDRAVEQAALLEPVQRVERHHFRQVARDPEDDEDVRGHRGLFCHACLDLGCSRRHVQSPSWSTSSASSLVPERHCRIVHLG